jgi:hypothetical protein
MLAFLLVMVVMAIGGYTQGVIGTVGLQTCGYQQYNVTEVRILTTPLSLTLIQA